MLFAGSGNALGFIVAGLTVFPNKLGDGSKAFEFTKERLIDVTEGGSNKYDDNSDAILSCIIYYIDIIF
jgi:hypothetical protein